MPHYGPILTLGGAVFAGAFTVMSIVTVANDEPAERPVAVSSPIQTPTPSASDVPAPSPSDVPAPSPTGEADRSGYDAPPDYEAAPGSAKYTGRAKNGAQVTLTVKNGAAKAYVCGGGVEEWLKGDAEGTGLDLAGDGDDRLTGDRTGKKATGTIWIGGKRTTFTASRKGS